MRVQDLCRIINEREEIEIKNNNGICLWYGENEAIPVEYLEKIVNSIYSLKGVYESYIVIELC